MPPRKKKAPAPPGGEHTALPAAPTTAEHQALTEEEARRRFLDGVRRLGTVLAGCREARISRAAYRRWMTDPAFAEALEDARADFRDSLEQRLMERIDEHGDGMTLRFKVKGEIPEKYGGRLSAQADPLPDAVWRDVESQAGMRGTPGDDGEDDAAI